MTFYADIKRFSGKQDIARIVEEATRIFADEFVNGGPLSGAPGQPADLRDKFPITREGEIVSIATSDPSALAVETSISSINGQPVTLKSEVGGFHSRALVVNARQAIVDEAARRING